MYVLILCFNYYLVPALDLAVHYKYIIDTLCSVMVAHMDHVIASLATWYI